MDKPLLEAFGFGLSSDAVIKLAGAPQCEVRCGAGRRASQQAAHARAVAACAQRKHGAARPTHARRCLHRQPQSQDLTFTLLATKLSAPPGPCEVTLPLAVKGGCADSPAVLLTLRAHVVLPDVVPSAAALDFGTVWNCHCKVRAGRAAPS